MQALRVFVYRYFKPIPVTEAGRALALEQHKGILEALKARDGVLAEERMLAHLEGFDQRVLRYFQENPGAPAPGAKM